MADNWIGSGSRQRRSLVLVFGLYRLNQLAHSAGSQLVQEGRVPVPLSRPARTFPNASTARWEVNISPPYRLFCPGSNWPVVRRDLTRDKFCAWKWWSRTGWKTGRYPLSEKRAAYLSSGADSDLRRRTVGWCWCCAGMVVMVVAGSRNDCQGHYYIIANILTRLNSSILCTLLIVQNMDIFLLLSFLLLRCWRQVVE